MYMIMVRVGDEVVENGWMNVFGVRVGLVIRSFAG